MLPPVMSHQAAGQLGTSGSRLRQWTRLASRIQLTLFLPWLIGTPSADAATAHGNWSVLDTRQSSHHPSTWYLSGVSCTSSDRCMAVGLRNARPMAQRWDGSRWWLERPPLPTGSNGGGLFGVRCIRASDCIGVGYFSMPDHAFPFTLIEHWNGSRWTLTETAATLHGDLVAIDCLSGSACTAVGHRIDRAKDHSLVEHWDGYSWSIVPSPDPPDEGESTLDAVACLSDADCWAVGAAGHLFDDKGTLAEHWDGTSWAIVPSPNPPLMERAALLGVACPESTRCFATGRSDDGSDLDAWTLLEVWDGRSWAIPPDPAPVPALNGLAGVACTGPQWCMVVGDHRLPSDRVIASSEHWTGSQWVKQRPPLPYGSTGGQFFDVSCPGADRCVGVGQWIDSRDSTLALAERYTR
jgi:hypothetical protein